MAEAIRVNFGRPMPVFPLPDAVLLPHAIQPLLVFEPRYRKMIDDCLDGAGQIAVASFAARSLKGKSPKPSLRPVVCVGQIVQHEALEDGRHNILVQGVCRAKIVSMIEPENGRTYRLAMLSPLEPAGAHAAPLKQIRLQLRRMLKGPRLSRLRSVDTVMAWFDREDVSTEALLELIGFALLKDSELQYRLLAEASPVRRAGIIKDELASLDGLVARAERQPYRAWPKGMAWN
jgi:Lon protease-like protein